MKYLFLLILLGCKPEEKKVPKQSVEFRFLGQYRVVNGFYKGCSITLENRDSPYTFEGEMKCPQAVYATYHVNRVNPDDLAELSK